MAIIRAMVTAPKRGWLPRRLWRVAALGVLVAALATLIPLLDPRDSGATPADLAIYLAIALVWLAAGLLVLGRQPQATTGRLMVGISLASNVWVLSIVPVPALEVAGAVIFDLYVLMIVHLAIVWPSGRFGARWERWLVGFIYLYGIAFRVRQVVFQDWPGGPLLEIDPDVDALIGRAINLSVGVLSLIVLVVVARHVRASVGPARRTLRPLAIGVGILAALTVARFTAQELGMPVLSDLARSSIAIAIGDLIIPTAFLVGAMRMQLVRLSLGGTLIEASQIADPWGLETDLRRRLDDPRLQVLRWSPAAGSFIDRDGRAVTVPGPADHVALAVIERNGQPSAGVLYDAVLNDDPQLIDAVRGVVRLSIDASDRDEELRSRGGDVAGLPAGEVVFLFGDIEGSTPLLEQLTDRYADLLATFRLLVTATLADHGGRLVDSRGDEVFAVLSDPAAAVRAGVAIHEAMATAAWPDGVRVRVRLGLHLARPMLTSAGYVGVDVHRAARVMAASHGGQTIATTELVERATDVPNVSVRSLGRYTLRGLTEPVGLWQVARTGDMDTFPPPRAEPVPPATGARP